MCLFTAPRNQLTCPGPNNLPPLQFHTVHGDNIRISRDGFVARRVESFCKGVVFSARPLKVNERVCVKFQEISNNWSGVIRFGFTSVDPATLRYGLPKYVCPDLTNKPGFWAKALHERHCVRNNVLFYYVTSSGDVHFGINGEEKGVFMTDVDARSPLWAVIDVYGNSTVIELLDSRIYAFQQQQQQAQAQQVQQQSVQQHHQIVRRESVVVDPIITGMDSMSIHSSASSDSTIHVPPLRFSQNVVPISFHCTKGRNIRMRGERNIAIRNETEFCQGYVFTSRPIRIGERFTVQILKTESMYVGSLALGLTSCDPASLQPVRDLPDDCDLLLDRPEYWVVSKDIAELSRYDEIKFCVTPAGELQISKNGGPPRVVMHVDQSLQLWAFLDVYGSTQSVAMFSEMMPSPTHQMQPTPMAAAVALGQSRQSLPEAQQQLTSGCTNTRIALSTHTSSNEMIQLPTGGTVLVVNLPPAQAASDSVAAVRQTVSATIPQHSPASEPQYIQVRIDSNLFSFSPYLLSQF